MKKTSMAQAIKAMQKVTQEAFDGDPMTRGHDTALDGQSVRLDQLIDAFDGQAHTNERTHEFRNGQIDIRATQEALDGRAETSLENDILNDGKPAQRKLPTPFDRPEPSPMRR